MNKRSERKIRISAENAHGIKYSNYFNIYSIDLPKFGDILVHDMVYEAGKYIQTVDFGQLFSSGGEITNYVLHNASRWLKISDTGILYGEQHSEGILEDVYVSASNEVGIAYSNKFEIHFIHLPVFTGKIEHLFVEVGRPIEPVDISYHFSTGGTIHGYTLENSSPWMKISKDGIITGIPIDSNIENVKVIGRNLLGKVKSNSFTVETYTDIPIFSIDIDNNWAFVDKLFRYDISDSFRTGGFITWYEINNAPFWLTIDDHGVLHGTPELNDKITNLGITIVAGNSSGNIESNPFSIEVQDMPKFIGHIQTLNVTLGEPFYHNISEHFEDVDYYEIHNKVPDWVVIHLSGTVFIDAPIHKVISRVWIEGINKRGSVISNKFDIDIREIPIFLYVIPDIFVDEGDPIKIKTSNYLNDAKIDNYALVNNPSWLTIDENTGDIVATAEKGYFEDIYITATNPVGIHESNPFIIGVSTMPVFIGIIETIRGIVGQPLVEIDISNHFSSDAGIESYSFIDMYRRGSLVPSWINISDKGIISGIPDTSDITVDIRITAKNKSGIAESNHFNIEILAHKGGKKI